MVVRRPYLVPIPFLEKPVKILGALWWGLQLVFSERPCRVHGAHVLSTGVVAWVLKKWCRTEYVLYTHSADIMSYYGIAPVRWLLHRVLAGAVIVAASNSFTALKLKDMGVLPERIRILFPCIDPDKDTRAPLKTLIPEEFCLDGKRIILGVNRLVERKGNDTMIQAMPRLLGEFPDLCYVIFGRGPEEARLKALALALGVAAAVRFIPGGPDALKNALYRACEVFVMISRDIPRKGDHEGFGVVYLEANVFGKPVVAGDSGGVRDAVADKVSGLLVKPSDPAAAADAVAALLRDKELAARLGIQGRARVVQDFNVHRPVEAFKDISGVV
jgi:phosphatidylinositol alpha-1,6-mannosyltransferase